MRGLDFTMAENEVPLHYPKVFMTESFSDFAYPSADGLKLHARLYGSADIKAPIVCLPGLTRNVRDFHELALFLSTRDRAPRRVIAFDYRGRGGSDYDPDWKNYTIAVEAQDILDGLSALGIGEASFIGTSRGGLIIHLLATLQPAMLKAVVLNDIGPVIEADGLRHIRSYLERSVATDSMDDAIANQRAIHADSFPALLDADWQRLAEAVYRIENGRPVADFDPALIRTIATLDLDRPIPTLWRQFEALRLLPLLVIRGTNSKLLSAATVTEMQSRHPGMEVVTVAGQGHPPMLETAGLPHLIAAFLDRQL